MGTAVTKGAEGETAGGDDAMEEDTPSKKEGAAGGGAGKDKDINSDDDDSDENEVS